MYKVGNRLVVVKVEPLEFNKVAPSLKMGEEKKIKGIILDSASNQHLNVGLASEYNYITSHETKEELKDGDKIHWCHPSRFRPVYTFFWNGPFSNWYLSPFTMNNMEFICEEQHMMYWKAVTFEDYVTATKIMESESPKFQKALGRQVANFDPTHWAEVCEEIVYEGLRQKFLQNPELLEELRKAKGTILVEASPEDGVWGIGYNETDALDHIDDWGENKLGKLLTKLCEEICK